MNEAPAILPLTRAARLTAYCASSAEDELVIPALIVQVENEGDGKVTQTDLGEVIRTITVRGE